MNCPLQARRCGGCTRLSVPYEQQLAFKQKYTARLFPGADVYPIIGMETPYHYRNKVISAFAHDKSGLISGTFAYGTHYVLPVEECLLENEEADRVVRVLRGILNARHIKAYDEDRRSGLIRFVQVRYAIKTGEALVTVVTAQEAFPCSDEIARELMERCPCVKTVVQNVNPRPGSLVLGTREKVLAGPGTIRDEFLGLHVILSSRSFYQINTAQAQVLYQKALDMSGLRPDDSALDVYCGIGLIGLLASRQVKRVTGIEINHSAIQNARSMAKINGAGNVSFLQGDASLMRSMKDISLALLDPPRSGLDAAALDALLSLRPERICYISCNPVTQARDLKALSSAGYRLHAVQPVDMFPHTDHVETVASLSRQRIAPDDA